MLKHILGALLLLALVVAAFLLVSLVVWWLVPLAFPALTFTYFNAMALTLLAGLLGAPAATN